MRLRVALCRRRRSAEPPDDLLGDLAGRRAAATARDPRRGPAPESSDPGYEALARRIAVAPYGVAISPAAGNILSRTSGRSPMMIWRIVSLEAEQVISPSASWRAGRDSRWPRPRARAVGRHRSAGIPSMHLGTFASGCAIAFPRRPPRRASSSWRSSSLPAPYNPITHEDRRTP